MMVEDETLKINSWDTPGQFTAKQNKNLFDNYISHN